MAYKGKFRPKNPSKYCGNPDNIVHRSLWERQAFRFLDENPAVKKWSSEEVIVPYRCKTDGKLHRYFCDLFIEMHSGARYLIEIKPSSQTKPPREPKRKTKRFITEVMTYAKNVSKWEAAEEYASARGWVFEIWDEHTLKAMGIRLVLG